MKSWFDWMPAYAGKTGEDATRYYGELTWLGDRQNV
jgi:hypothetical protein